MNTSLSAVFGAVSRHTISAIGALYAAGLLIVNADLAYFGLVSLDLARPEYVLVGALWAFISLPLQLSGILAAFSLPARRVRGFRLKLGRVIVFFFFALLLPVVTVHLIAEFGSPISEPFAIPWLAIVAVGANGATVIAAGYILRALHAASTTEPQQRGVVQTSVLALSGFAVVLLLIVNLTVYSTLLYPGFPKRLGGGKKPRALVVLNEPHAAHSELPLPKDGRVIGPVAVLLETGNAVAVIGYDDNIRVEQQGVHYNIGAVSFERRHISSVIYLKAPTRQAK
jgi:hypothetical protein